MLHLITCHGHIMPRLEALVYRVICLPPYNNGCVGEGVLLFHVFNYVINKGKC